ncbi:hypothetical protein D8I24_6316 [Cupriavidus necator H850]|nr:hypothetical protein D8I24_6316 [Cupriavidus necator H850]
MLRRWRERGPSPPAAVRPSWPPAGIPAPRQVSDSGAIQGASQPAMRLPEPFH